MKKFAIVISFLASFCYCLNLPSEFKKCDRRNIDFHQCLPLAVEDAIRKLIKPFKEYGLPNLEPTELLNVAIAAGRGAIAFEQNYTFMHILGHSNIEVKKFVMNFDTNTIVMECFFPELVYDLTMSFNGTFLAVPIYGSGTGRLILENAVYVLTFKLDEYLKNDKKYYKVVDANLAIDAEMMKDIAFKGLYDGDELLEKRMNKLFNDNWEIVFYQGKEPYEILLAKYFAAVFNNLLTKVSASELFGEE